MKTTSLLKSTSLVSAMTLLSRVLGLAREVVFAYIFGASAGMDAFFVAFKIPNFMRRLFAEGAFAQAFVPVLSEYRQTRSREEAQEFINRMAGSLFSALLIVLIAAEILVPVFVVVFAPGFIDKPVSFNLAKDMLHITFPYLLLIALTAFSGSVLNSYGSFGIPAFTPVLLNVMLIVAALFLAPHFQEPVVALAWGVFAGGALQLLFQIPFLYWRGLLPKPQLLWRDPGVQKVLKLMIPALFGVSVAQIGLLLDTLFASFLPAGSISWLYYSDRLTNFPLGVFGVALATVALPHLARQHADSNPESYSKALDWALRCVLVVGIPSAVGLVLLSGPLLATIFNYGAFNNGHNIFMVQQSLMAFAIGLPAFMLVKVLASGFYSRQNIRTPVRIAVVALIVNMVLNIILIFPLKHAGLALATSIASGVNSSLLWFWLIRKGFYTPQVGWLKYAGRLLIATALMAGLLWWGSPALKVWLQWGFTTRAMHLAFWLIAGVLVYFASLAILGIRFKDFRSPGTSK